MALRKVKNDTINGNCLSKEQQYIEKQKAIEASKKQEYKNDNIFKHMFGNNYS